METNKFVSRRQVRIAIIIISLFILFVIGHPFVKKYYLDPYSYKKKCFDSVKRSPELKHFDDDKIREFCNCTYEKLLSKYKNNKDIPNEAGFTTDDKYDVYNCLIDYLIEDSLRNEYRKNIDIVIDQL
jgi:hypothetical protein